MSSDQIIKWLNEEARLSKKVTNIEKDFANGKLFYELLISQHQKIHPDSLSLLKDTPADRFNNLKALEPSFKNVNIKLDSKTADMIAREERGAAFKILYQFRLMTESRNKAGKLTAPRSPEALHGTLSAKKSQALYASATKASTPGYNKSITQFTRSDVKPMDLDKKLERFELTRIQNEEKALRDIQKMQKRYEEVKNEARQKHLDTLRRNKEYIKEMDTKGWEEWKKNDDVKANRLAKEKDFDDRMTDAMKRRYLQKEELERLDATEGMRHFELNAQKLGIELEHDPDELNKIEKVEASQSAMMMKLKEKADQSELARKEKEKRMRKMKVDQEKAQNEIEARKREEALVEKLMEHSIKESNTCYNKWRGEQMKTIMTENQKVKEMAQREKKAQEIQRMQDEKDSRSVGPTEEEKREARLKKLSQRENNLEMLIDKRQRHSTIMTYLFNQIMEITEMCFQNQQNGDAVQVDSVFWRNCADLFADDKIVLPKKKLRHEGLDSMEKNPEAEQQMERYLFSELHNYLNGLETWRPNHKLPPGEEFMSSVLERPISNEALGSVVQNIIDTTYPANQPQKPSSEIPNHLPLRLVSLGYPFSGRKTLGAFLKQKYGVEMFRIDEIVKEAVELNAPPPVEDPKKAKKAPKGKEPEVIKQENEELKAVGQIIKELQEKGESVPVGVYIDAFKAKLKEFFPALTQEQLLNELKAYKQKEEERVLELQKQAEAEAKKKKPPAKKDAAPEPESVVVIQKRPYYTKGWMLLGFPGTLEEAKKFEQIISGFQVEEELLNLEAEEKKKRADIIVKIPVKPPVKKKFVEGGIDCAIKLEVSREECLKRASGRRVDPKTGNIYHLQNNPPPANDNALMGRLIPIDDPENTEAKLNLKMDKYDENKDELEGWYDIFGVEEIKVDCLQRFEGVAKPEEVCARVEEHLNKILEHKTKEKYDKILEQEESIRQKEQQESERQVKLTEDKSEKLTQKDPSEKADESKDTTLLKEEEDLVAELEKRSSRKPESTFKDDIKVLSSTWEVIQESYITAAKEAFTNMNAQRSFISSRFAEIQARFLEILQKQGEKLTTLKKFYEKFNRFTEDQREILDDPETKDELNQRLDDLQDKLWSIIEAKKDKAVKERQDIIESGYIEDEMEFFIGNVQKLVQAELDRHFDTTKVVKNYYACLDGKGPLDPFEASEVEVLPPADQCPPIESPENSDSFPRLELLYQNALQFLGGDDIMSPPIRKRTSMYSKKMSVSVLEDKRKRMDSVHSFETQGPTANDKLAEEIVKVETKILRYRLFVLYTTAVTRVKEMRLMAKALFNKMDDWIIYGIKAENDALYEQTKGIRKAIEKQEKLQRELTAAYPDVTLIHKPLDYANLPPTSLPPGEIVERERFTLTQLVGLTEELSFLMDDNGAIPTTTLSQFLTRRMTSPVSKNDFPADWIEKTHKNCCKIIDNLDVQSQGSISWKVLCSQLCLLDAPVPTISQLTDYANALMGLSEGGMINCEEFTKCPSFFDRDETFIQQLNHHPVFDRASLLKGLLFYINKDIEQDLMDVNEYISNIGKIKLLMPEAEMEAEAQAKEDAIKKGKSKKGKDSARASKKYSDVLFTNT